MQAQLQGLVHKRFIADTEYSQLAHFPRYLKAMNVRLEKLRTNPARDAQLMAEWQTAASQFQRTIKNQPLKNLDPRMTDFRWMLEELRVSLFAQELRTPMPVSSKRLQKVWESMLRYGTPARRMSYWLYLPNKQPEDVQGKGLPLLVMLHGCHQTATQFAQGTRMNHWAEKMGYAVLYPQQLVSTQAQRCWKWYDRATQEGGGDVPMIVGMIDKVMSQYAIDRSRIYVAGISAGAGMANIIALNHPRLIAAVGLHSGPVFGAGHSTMGALGVMQHGAGMRADVAVREVLSRHAPFPRMPTIIIQGEGDNVVRPINQIQLARQSLLLNGLAAEPKITHKPQGRGGRHNAHQIHDFYDGRKLVLRVAQIAELDHAWSGGDAALAFNAKAGPDASKMMLEFFTRHRRT
jgi:poly(hydroxyalkanoate) depolymerase family esterase